METLIEYLFSSSISEMKTRIIQGEFQVYSFGGKENLNEHTEMLKGEFVGRTELELYHAILMVLIRREIDLPSNIKRLQDLWSQEAKFLCQNLDSRWLVSMCDTIVDYWTNDSERALAMAGSLFTNTLKLYETERWATGKFEMTENYKPVSGRIPLHDGLSGFVIGHGDMILNLHKRVHSFSNLNAPAAVILLELLHRASMHDTVFRRFKNIHQNNKTNWSKHNEI